MSPYERMLKEHKAAVAKLEKEIERGNPNVESMRASIDRVAANLRKNVDFKDGDL